MRRRRPEGHGAPAVASAVSASISDDGTPRINGRLTVLDQRLEGE